MTFFPSPTSAFNMGEDHLNLDRRRLRRHRRPGIVVAMMRSRFLWCLCLLAWERRAEGSAPLALHRVVEVAPGEEVTVRLPGYDLDGDDLVATITSLPRSGTLLQLSRVYSDYGYDPKAGEIFGDVGVNVTGSGNRVVYRRPKADSMPKGLWGRFTYTVGDGHSSAKDGTIYLVSPEGILASAEFDTGAGTWQVCQDGSSRCSAARHDASSRGVMRFFVSGMDSIIHTNGDGVDDTLWWFKAGPAFSGNLGVSYGGVIEFSLGSFSGSFSKENLNGDDLQLVELHCSTCARNTGTTLSFPLSEAGGFLGAGNGVSFSLPLLEGQGWLKDPENSLKSGVAPSKCEMAEVLSNLSELRILGDFTRRYESIALDSVYIRWKGSGTTKTSGSGLPVCAQGSPDATVCTC